MDKVVKREVIEERPPMWGKTYWNYKVKGCFNCKFYRRLQDCKNLDEESFEMFIYTTFKTGICNNYRPEEIDAMDLTPEQRKHFKKVTRKEGINIANWLGYYYDEFEDV